MNNEYNKKEGSKERLIGIGIVAGVIVLTLVIVMLFNGGNSKMDTIYVATGGGKEDFLADEEIAKILKKDYKIDVVYDSWSNGKTVTAPLVREYVHEGNSNVSEYDWNVNNDSCSKYDALFTSDERFYDYYKLSPDKSKEEADRYYVKNGSLTLNTPIVIYSWKEVADILEKEKIVTKEDNIYYITDMEKLLNYILEGKTWSDIGLSKVYGKINIYSTDPVTSSPGATYYGLLLSIMTSGDMSEEKVNEVLPKLKEFYLKSGYMNNTPADLFEMYLKQGVGAKPMIVDYEKSIISLATSDKNAYDSVKDKMVILYPRPTVWNSHCLATFTDKGNKYLKAFDNKDIQQIAWSKYGFRVGVSGGSYDVSKVNVSGIPQEITSITSGLKMDVYNQIIDYLK
ncbi:MAG: hypothetical protein E7158_03525 [Firmicutes bacterium]|nr:hypothetical protein [Bacillota bacterium]